MACTGGWLSGAHLPAPGLSSSEPVRLRWRVRPLESRLRQNSHIPPAHRAALPGEPGRPREPGRAGPARCVPPPPGPGMPRQPACAPSSCRGRRGGAGTGVAVAGGGGWWSGVGTRATGASGGERDAGGVLRNVLAGRAAPRARKRLN